MLDVAIVGAGLCGLALARQLAAAGRDCALFEARPRPGGRIRTVARDGLALDLGATWFWPDAEPRIAALLEDLGLASFAQHDQGEALQLSDPNRAPEVLASNGVHGGARRIAGGAQRLIEALADGLPPGVLRLDMRLKSVRRDPDGVTLGFQHQGSEVTVRARHVVLALPPRLLAEQVAFTPALDALVMDALTATPTWMAAQAKAMATYGAPFWRVAGRSGNAFVDHVQVVLREVFDACDTQATQAALGGFLALPPALRESFRLGMPMLITSQLAQLFGPDAQSARQVQMQDWALEPDTCSTLDRMEFAAAPPMQLGHPLLRQAHWSGRLYFGGSETASHGACHMEGAIDAAARIGRALAAASNAAGTDAATALTAFGDWVEQARARSAERYRGHLTRLLATQQYGELTQRALLATAEQTYSEALARLGETLPMLPGTPVVEGRSELTPLVLAPFSGWSKQLVEQARAFNGTSCALSNFPHEHQPDGHYVQAMARDLMAAWQEFALQANDLLLVRSAASPVRPGRAQLLAAIEAAGVAVLTLTEAVEAAELLASKLTRREVERHLGVIADSAAQLDAATRATVAEVDWAGWQALQPLLADSGADLDEALWQAVSERLPATVAWMRTYRANQPELFANG